VQVYFLASDGEELSFILWPLFSGQKSLQGKDDKEVSETF
jgi:hypothetical protein